MKIDSKTGQGIFNTKIAFYKDNDLIYQGLTDNNGKIILNNLPLASYKIIEVESNKDYLKTNEVIYFDIKSNKEIINITMKNDKIEKNETIKEEISVPNTLSFKNNKLRSLSLVFIVLSFNIIIYVLFKKFYFNKYGWVINNYWLFHYIS